MNHENKERPTTDQGSALAVIETDTFCEKCGFNLHTQRVWRDDRLGILVCRCPECGSHSAAGRNVSVTTPWLNRLTTGLMLIYVAMAVLFVIGAFFGSVGIYAAAEEGLIYREIVSDTGQPIRYGSIANPNGTYQQIWVVDDAEGATTVPNDRIRERIGLVPWLKGRTMPSNRNYYYGAVPMWPALLITTLMATGMVIIGVILAAGSWHWRRRRQYVWIVIPILAFGFVLSLAMPQPPEYSRWGASVLPLDPRPLQWRLFLAVLVLQVIILTIALRFGRPILRLLLQIFVGPKTRQVFAFLWHCDGKTLPAARTRYES